MTGYRNQRRKRIQEVKETLSDKQVFLSKEYHDTLWKYAKVVGGKKDVTLNIWYEEAENSGIASTNGEHIFLNAANRITMGFPDRKQRAVSHEGFVAHECGHIRFSDFERRNVYVGGFERGLIFPEAPKNLESADQRAWYEMKKYFVNVDKPALFYIQDWARYFSNLLEDVYIETCICEKYPGSVRFSIRQNAAAQIASIPTEEARKEKGAPELIIVSDLIFRYARAGRTDTEKEYSSSYLKCLDRCREVIDIGVTSPDPDERLLATNRLLLRIWKYLKPELRKFQKEAKNLSEEEMKKNLEGKRTRGCRPVQISMGSSGVSGKTTIKGWNGDPEGGQKKSESNTDCTKEGEPKNEGEEGKENLQENRSGQNRQNRQNQKNRQSGQKEGQGESENTKPFMLRQQLFGLGSGNGQKAGGSDAFGAGMAGGNGGGGDVSEISKKLPEILNRAAEKAVMQEEEEKLVQDLKKQAKEMHLNDIHKDVVLQIHRADQIPDGREEEYRLLEPEIRKASRTLEKTVAELLNSRKGGRLSGLYMGKRLDKNSLFRQDGRVFEKRIAPDGGKSAAFAILVDNSGSMWWDNRIGISRLTSLVLYDFCRRLSIPVMVYGHSTHKIGGREFVDIRAYADFDSTDGLDHLRIAGMCESGKNRDGAALQFVGERLLKREEDIKILVLISDGLPAGANGYEGDVAKADLQSIEQELKRKGVLLFAAAIGDDRRQIEEIYQDGFLNISDLRTMPAKLAALLTKYIR